MKIAVIGSTGRTGRLLLEEGLRRGHVMTALVVVKKRMMVE